MMFQFLLYLHVLSAILMGAYLVMPFLSGKLASLSGSAQYGFLNVLSGFNRAGQFALILAFLTGGYMVGKGSYSVLWMVLAVVLLLAIGAVSGIMGKKMRQALADVSGSKIAGQLGAIRSLSLVLAILVFVTVTLMKFPNYL
ncbi:hypothetical protein [Paenibacillus silviterrae]|jgi:hypothetical protein|uniref:hypothetical protein n=1 Tax=Paenibacillus silviterrae TaxID=3242194 RepID=UPI002543379E|nr:hypothetical protein [Paenibacillus chinjuensis]